jgi:hypothetical protein
MINTHYEKCPITYPGEVHASLFISLRNSKCYIVTFIFTPFSVLESISTILQLSYEYYNI